jgi:hypothetical protein
MKTPFSGLEITKYVISYAKALKKAFPRKALFSGLKTTHMTMS